MAAKLESAEGRALYKLRRQTVEPVFGIIKAVLGFTGFSPRGLDKVAGEWDLVALAYNRKRPHKLKLEIALSRRRRPDTSLHRPPRPAGELEIPDTPGPRTKIQELSSRFSHQLEKRQPNLSAQHPSPQVRQTASR